MYEHFIQLKENMERDLENLSMKTDSPVNNYDKCAETVQAYMEEIKSWLRDHPFPDDKSVIHFFKYIAPVFYCRYIFYVKLYNSELFRITEDDNKYLDFIANEIEHVSNVMQQHVGLYRYYSSGRNTYDSTYFVPENTRNSLSIHAVTRDGYYCAASFRLGEILAYQEYKKVLLKIQEEKDPERFAQTSYKPAGEEQWNLSKAEAVELLTCLYELQAINIDGKPATLKHLKIKFEKQFNLTLGNIHAIDEQNRARKKEDTILLNKMTNAYLSRKDRLLNC